jgi:hypothetical protein
MITRLETSGFDGGIDRYDSGGIGTLMMDQMRTAWAATYIKG